MDTIIVNIPTITFSKRYMQDLIAPLLFAIFFVVFFSYYSKNGFDKTAMIVLCFVVFFLVFRAFKWAKFHIKKIEQKDNKILIMYDEFSTEKCLSINVGEFSVELDKAFIKGNVSKLIIREKSTTFKVVQYEIHGWTKELIQDVYSKLKVLSNN